MGLGACVTGAKVKSYTREREREIGREMGVRGIEGWRERRERERDGRGEREREGRGEGEEREGEERRGRERELDGEREKGREAGERQRG